MNHSFTCSYGYCKHEWRDSCSPGRNVYDESYVRSPGKSSKGKTFGGGMSWEEGVGDAKEAKKVTGGEKKEAVEGANN